jgi:hypothetical protein
MAVLQRIENGPESCLADKQDKEVPVFAYISLYAMYIFDRHLYLDTVILPSLPHCYGNDFCHANLLIFDCLSTISYTVV